MRTLFEGLEEAFRFLDGVPKEILFDQMRSAIVEDRRWEGGPLVENPEFVRFAHHWQFRGSCHLLHQLPVGVRGHPTDAHAASGDIDDKGFSLAASVFAGLVLGLAPALQSTNPDMSATIKDESAGVGRSGALTLRNALVVAQVATSLVLLVGAGLFLRSLERVQTVDPGFGHDPAAILSLAVPSTRYSEEEGRLFADRMLSRFREIPGVEASGLTSNLHLNMFSTSNITINVDGVEPPPGRESHMIDRAMVSPGFLDAAGV